MEEVFVTAVKMLKAKGFIKLENYFVDGTNIETAAGWTTPWGKLGEDHKRSGTGTDGTGGFFAYDSAGRPRRDGRGTGRS
jgi:hypothetical protein